MNIEYSAHDAKKLLRWLIGVEIAFAAVYLLLHISPDSSLEVASALLPWDTARHLFDLNSEQSIPTWFSSVQLFAVATVLFTAAKTTHKEKPRVSFFLVMGSLLFVFLSADEAATIHERVQAIAKNLELNWLMMFQGALGAWIPIYAVAAIALLFVTGRYMRVMWRLFRGESLIALWGEPYTLRGLSALK